MNLEDIILLAVSLNLILTLMILARMGLIKKELVKLRRKRLAPQPAAKKKGRPSSGLP